MCEKYGKNPCYYLFNGKVCAHTRLVIDMTIFDVYALYCEKDRKKQESKQKEQERLNRPVP